ncbi:S41 family peptidase [Porphyromonas crevioricanis]|nr:carboxy-terminal processing protease [Porphyromonas crevioricanis JCM 13913]
MKNTQRISLLLFIGLLFCPHAWSQYREQMLSSMSKIGQSIRLIQELYVDSVDTDKLTEDAIRGMLDKLDPHSVYVNAEENKDELSALEGKFSGVGIQFNLLTDTLYVVQVIPGGPSEKAGLMPGDRILAVDGENIAGVKIKNSTVMHKLRGDKGTLVRLSVLRGKRIQDYVITRGDIPIHSREAAYIIPGTNIGYMRFSRFSLNTVEEFEEGINKLLSSGMQSLIIDLRYNGGGIMSAATEMASYFLPVGSKLLTVKNNRKPFFNEELRVEKRQKINLQRLPLIVLVNEYSASASEIFSGAIQDWDRGLIIGRRSFGKGLVQRPVPLSDGSSIRITVARYYTPSGRSIQKPYIKGNAQAYEEDIYARLKHGELMHADSIKFPDSLRYQTLRQNRSVYGGGGIMPDIFVPLDTTRFNSLEKELLNTASLIRVIPIYLDTERANLLKTYPKAAQFVDNYNLPNTLIDLLKKTAEENGVKWNKQLFAEREKEITTMLKAYIARSIYDEDTFYSLINQQDREYQEAIRILSAGNNQPSRP